MVALLIFILYNNTNLYRCFMLRLLELIIIIFLEVIYWYLKRLTALIFDRCGEYKAKHRVYSLKNRKIMSIKQQIEGHIGIFTILSFLRKQKQL